MYRGYLLQAFFHQSRKTQFSCQKNSVQFLPTTQFNFCQKLRFFHKKTHLIGAKTGKNNTMVYEIRASADMIRANCLFSAVGWKEWGRKKDRKRLFPTTPTSQQPEKRVCSNYMCIRSTLVDHGIIWKRPFACLKFEDKLLLLFGERTSMKDLIR